MQVELDFYVKLAFAAGHPTLPPLSTSELAPITSQSSVCIQLHRQEFSIAAGLALGALEAGKPPSALEAGKQGGQRPGIRVGRAGLGLDVDFVATGGSLHDVAVFNLPVYLVCFSPQCQPGNFGTSSGTVPKAS